MAQNQPQPLTRMLLRLPVVCHASGQARSTLYRNIKAGLFTKPVDIGGDRKAWPSNEVQSIVDARIAGATDDEVKKLVRELEAQRKTLLA